MRTLEHLFKNNRDWVARMQKGQPGFFADLARQQSPRYLWIGCSDSRVPANEIVGLRPGELFVHRNVANVVVHTDFNCLSVIQYAIEVLGVRDVIVCGHYGCGGVATAVGRPGNGLIDNWLRHVRDVYTRHRHGLDAVSGSDAMLDRLCELNVIEQVRTVCGTTILQDAWGRGQSVSVHGWVYNIQDGLLRDLGPCITGPDEVESLCDAAAQNALAGQG
ncbi:MAG: carbonate dehydratase [Planctomycetota bacterium]|nr:carbonate dehydratase [Planctomycetota bacterium]